MTCTCTVEVRHLRDLAEPLRQADYHAVLRDDQQLEVSGGDNVPYWEQRSSWLVQCQRADEQSPWQYRYEDGEPLGDVDDKPLVLFRLKARIHGIDHVSGDPARRLLVESLRPV
jgi:hypothetical protein